MLEFWLTAEGCFIDGSLVCLVVEGLFADEGLFSDEGCRTFGRS